MSFGKQAGSSLLAEITCLQSQADWLALAGILDALEIQKAAVIGHDWGAILAWAVAATMPERTAVLCAISVGHPNGFFKHEESYQQKQKSW